MLKKSMKSMVGTILENSKRLLKSLEEQHSIAFAEVGYRNMMDGDG